MIRRRTRAPPFRGRAGARPSTTAAEFPPPARRRLVYFFDLDDTLHDASHAIFRQIDTRMTDYVERHLDLDRGEANRLRTLYWHRYGATLLGLVRHHAVDATHFLRETHDFDVAALVRAERGLARLFARLPGRKVLLTNAPLAYASEVLRALAVHRHFRSRYTIEKMRLHGTFRPKPSRMMLRAMLARERVPASQARPRRGQHRQPEGGPRARVSHRADDRARNPDCRGRRLHATAPGGPCRSRDPFAAQLPQGLGRLRR